MNLMLLVTACAANLKADPSGGWLSYARYDAPNPTDIITRLSATMIVPELPTAKGGSPAFWFGGSCPRSLILLHSLNCPCVLVQTNKGDGALIQPIMAKWLGRCVCANRRKKEEERG